MDKNRYQRQIILPEIGPEGQERVGQAKILCIGAGGLGCPALLYLAAAGVGTLGIVDDDNIDVTNLQRQILFDTAQKEQLKTDAAAQKLTALNPDININTYPERLTAANALERMKGYDVIIDGTDNFESKFLINDAAVKLGKPVVYGSILSFEGQVSVFHAEKGPCYRCLYPTPPKGHIQNCAEAGVIGALAGMIGSAQAMEAIKLIVQNENLQPLTGRLWIIDTRTMQSQTLSIPKKTDCPVCSKRPEDVRLQYTAPLCSSIKTLTPEQVQSKLNMCLIDVRDEHEWKKGCIEGATLWPLSKMMKGHLPELTQGQEIVLHCQKGMRSLQAAQILKENGFVNVYSLSGGYEAWLKQYPKLIQQP